ncbi:iron-sulfur cluster assembly protein [Geodermatophilus sp. SYSU D00710]
MSGPVELLTVPGEGRPGRADDAAVAAALEQVVDPCSVAQGTPLSLPAMGLVRGWQLADDGRLVLDVAVTAPGCGYLGVFADAAARALAALPGVTSVTVRLDAALVWTEDLLRPDATAVLSAGRERVRERLAAGRGAVRP